MFITGADNLIESSLLSVAKIADIAAGMISDDEVIMTHSYSSTVLEALKAAGARHNISVIVTRSGAGRTGEKAARELSLAGIKVTFIDDTAVGTFISRVGRVMVGADKVCYGGSLINGIGTSMLALMAKASGVPFYVVCDTLKFNLDASSCEVMLEEKDSAEVVGPGILPESVTVKNPYFDVTPVGLITGFITEDGMVSPDDLV